MQTEVRLTEEERLEIVIGAVEKFLQRYPRHVNCGWIGSDCCACGVKELMIALDAVKP